MLITVNTAFTIVEETAAIVKANIPKVKLNRNGELLLGKEVLAHRWLVRCKKMKVMQVVEYLILE